MTVVCPGPNCNTTLVEGSRRRPCCSDCRGTRSLECPNPKCDVDRVAYRSPDLIFVHTLKYAARRAAARAADPDYTVLEVHTECEKCQTCHSCVVSGKQRPTKPCFPKGVVR